MPRKIPGGLGDWSPKPSNSLIAAPSTTSRTLNVELPHAFAGKLLFGSDGPVKVWVNGQEIGVIADATNPCKPDEYQLPTNWLEGLNDIVFALDTNGGNAWGLCARIVPA